MKDKPNITLYFKYVEQFKITINNTKNYSLKKIYKKLFKKNIVIKDCRIKRIYNLSNQYGFIWITLKNNKLMNIEHIVQNSEEFYLLYFHIDEYIKWLKEFLKQINKAKKITPTCVEVYQLFYDICKEIPEEKQADAIPIIKEISQNIEQKEIIAILPETPNNDTLDISVTDFVQKLEICSLDEELKEIDETPKIITEELLTPEIKIEKIETKKDIVPKEDIIIVEKIGESSNNLIFLQKNKNEKEKNVTPVRKEIKAKIEQEVILPLEEPVISDTSIRYLVQGKDGEIVFASLINVNGNPKTVEELIMASGLSIDNSNGFIEGIGGIKNEGMSGWVFEVNNQTVDVGASDFTLNGGETVLWKYVDFSELSEEKSMDKENIKELKMELPKEKVD